MTTNPDTSAPIVLVDPTAQRSPGTRPGAERLASLDGAVVALLDISKPRGDVFLDRVAAALEARGASIRRFRKPTFAKPAPIDLRHEIATTCTAVIEALAD